MVGEWELPRSMRREVGEDDSKGGRDSTLWEREAWDATRRDDPEAICERTPPPTCDDEG